MKVDVPTPVDGSPTQRVRRPVPDSIKFAVPMTMIAGGVIAALGWAWKVDKGQALTDQKVDEHERFIRRFENKLDDLRDLIVHPPRNTQ